MDTDALLKPTYDTQSQAKALMTVVEANTSALKEIKADLDKCDTVDKAQALSAKIDKAITDLSLDSQKVQPWIKAEPRDAYYGTVAYGQYPIDNPANPHNPVLAAEDMSGQGGGIDEPPWQPGDGKPPWAGGPGGPPKVTVTKTVVVDPKTK